MNAHVHVHCCVIDKVFVAEANGQVQFTQACALTPEDCGAVQQQLRARVQHELPSEGPRFSGDRQSGECCERPTRSPESHPALSEAAA